MGYTLAVPCKSTLARDRMADFLCATLRPFSVACDEAEAIRAKFDEYRESTSEGSGARALVMGLPSQHTAYDPTARVSVGNELGYGAGPSKIGFNFSTQGQFSIYMHAVLSWAALRVGRRRGLNALSIVGHADQKVAYITYDSTPIPVLRTRDMEGWTPEAADYGKHQWQVDRFGLRHFGDTTHYAGRWSPGGKTEEALVKAMWTRDKALRDITEREMRRLEVLWEDFMDRETR